MAVSVYKASSSYSPKQGVIYLDSAGGNNGKTVGKEQTTSASGNTYYGSGTNNTNVSGSSTKTTTSNRYSPSAQVTDLYNTSRGYADDVANMEYTPSQALLNYQNKLNDVENSKPAEFTSKYTDTINGLLDSILNEKEFSYTGQDMMNDDMYKMYSQMYEHNARKAMQDAMGNAQAQTGGYGSTYSQAAGQQAYDEQMSNMNDIALTLADRAYQQYLDNRSNRYNQLNAVNTQDNTDYSRYRDTVGDWQTDRDYYAGRYDSTYNQDYGAYRDSVADAQYLANLYSGLYDTTYDNELNAFNSNMNADQFDLNYALSQNADQRAQEEWDLNKQLLALQLAQAQQAAAGDTGTTGRYPGGSDTSNTKTKDTGSNNKSNVMTYDDTTFALNYINNLQASGKIDANQAAALKKQTATKSINDNVGAKAQTTMAKNMLAAAAKKFKK